MAEPRPELLARFGDDPDVLEWARWHVQQQIDFLDEAAALPQAGPAFVHLAGWCADFMRTTLIGVPGERGSTGAFDARFASARHAAPGAAGG